MGELLNNEISLTRHICTTAAQCSLFKGHLETQETLLHTLTPIMEACKR